MKLGTYSNFSRKEDIQIQTAISRLLVHIEIPNGVAAADVKFRIRAFGAKGFQPVTERTSILDLFEIAAAREGFYRRTQTATGQLFRGQIEIGVLGSLIMSSGSYLSLDVEAPFSIPAMELWAISGPFPVTKYHRYTPVTVQDTLKDVPLAGVDSLVFNPANVDAIKFQYPDQASDFDREELEAIGCNINDLVYADTSTGTVVCGFDRLIEMNTDKATRCTIEPRSTTPFNVLLISSETLF